MATNLQLDDRLITKAAKLGGHRTKRLAVTEALTQYIQHLEQQKISSLFGRIEYRDDHDHKRQRHRA